jgi:autotransporter-associated beta strand protein
LGIDTSGSTGGVTYAGNIGNTNSGANSLALLKIGSGTLTLSGTDTYTGGTTVSNGILVFKGASSIPVGSSLVIGTGTEQYGPASLASGVDAPSNVVSGNAASAPALQGASSTLNVAPEPTTLSMMFVVFAAVGFGVWRRRQGLGISG